LDVPYKSTQRAVVIAAPITPVIGAVREDIMPNPSATLAGAFVSTSGVRVVV